MKVSPRFVLGPARLLTLMILTLSLFGCDIASKTAAQGMLGRGEAVAVAPAVLGDAVELRYVENEDIAFNALRHLGVPRTPAVLLGLSGVALVAIGALALAPLAARRRREGREGGEGADPMTQASLALVVGGALGNVVDRVVRGYVIDFIHVKGWPVFNVADVAVVAGMALYFVAQLRARRTSTPPSG